MPFEYAKQMGTYEEEMGVDINWVSFDTGVKMSAAMASGDVQLSVSQGVPPFVVATSAGQDLQILDVAVSYADNDNCVVRSELEIDKDQRRRTGRQEGRRAARHRRALRLPQADEPFRRRHLDHGRGRHGSARRRRGDRPGRGRHVLRLGRLAAPRAGARQRAADRRREDRAWHPGLRRDLRPGRLGGRERRSGGQVPQGDRRRQRDVGRRGQPRRDAAGDRQGCRHGRRRDDGDHLDLRLPDRRRAAQRSLAGRQRADLHEGRGRCLRRSGLDRRGARHLRERGQHRPAVEAVGGM
jgi:hypothetical protein